MDDAHITLEIPDPDGFDDEDGHSIPVSSNAIAYTMGLLQCFIAQHRADEGCIPEHAVWDKLAAAAGHALAALLSAHDAYYHAHHAYYHAHDARALVEQIALFCRSDEAPRCLELLREPEAVDVPQNGPQAADIIAALLALWEQNERRREEQNERQRKQRKEQQATAEQRPATDRDPGWEF